VFDFQQRHKYYFTNSSFLAILKFFIYYNFDCGFSYILYIYTLLWQANLLSCTLFLFFLFVLRVPFSVLVIFY
jgi:hypothetical protein